MSLRSNPVRVRHNKPEDYIITRVSFVLYAMPTFLLGTLLILWFSIYLKLFPTEASQSTTVLGVLADPRALVLPVQHLGLLVQSHLVSRRRPVHHRRFQGRVVHQLRRRHPGAQLEPHRAPEGNGHGAGTALHNGQRRIQRPRFPKGSAGRLSTILFFLTRLSKVRLYESKTKLRRRTDTAAGGKIAG